jgi:hypothetical protein
VTAKPDGNRDIVVEEPAKKDPVTRVTSGATAATKAVVYYLVPVLTCLVGALASW